MKETALWLWNFNHQCICEQHRSCHARPAAYLYVTLYLLHGCVTANQLLPQVSNVVVKPLHVLLEVLPEVQKGLLHFALELLQAKIKT